MSHNYLRGNRKNNNQNAVREERKEVTKMGTTWKKEKILKNFVNVYLVSKVTPMQKYVPWIRRIEGNHELLKAILLTRELRTCARASCVYDVESGTRSLARFL